MKRLLLLSTIVTALALSASAFNFTPGNIVVYRIGDGTQPLTNTGNSVFLDEYTTNGTYVQTLPMPTNYFGGYYPYVDDGAAFASGEMSRSQDGRFLVMTGFGATLGEITNGAISSTASVLIPRVIATVDGSGHVDSTTALTNSLSSAETPRSAASTDGTNLWTSGDGAGLNNNTVGGIRYLTRGSSIVTQVFSTVTNLRQLNIFSNQLYFTTASGSAFRLGTSTNEPLPFDSSALFANIPIVTNSPVGFAFFNLSGGPGVDTVYVADSALNYSGEGNGAVVKYSLVGGTWVNSGSLGAAGAVFVTGVKNGPNVTLFITDSGTTAGNGAFYSGVDTSGFNGDPGSANDLNPGGILLSPHGLTSKFGTRGIAMAPQGAEAFPSGPGRLSVGPINGYFESDLNCGPFNDPQAFSLANPGTVSINWSASVDSNWVSLSATSGTLLSGGSVTVNASFNGNANSLPSGTNFCNIIFQNTSTDLGTTTQEVRLILIPQSVLPSSGFSPAGPPGGAFTPSSQVYTLSNGCSTIQWIATNTQSWLTITPSSGTLGANQGATITVSVNANANSLAAGAYTDTITFSNVTANAVIATRPVSLSAGFAFIFDDFSTYNTGPLLGQNGWQQNAAGTSNTFTITVSAGQAVIPGNVISTGQWLFKNFPDTTNPVVYAGMLMTVTSVYSTNANYANSMFQFNNGSLSGGFPLYELATRSPDTALTSFVFAARTSQQGNTPYTNGPVAFPVGQPIRVIMGSDVGGSNTTVYVNPSSGNVGSLTPYLVAIPTNGFTVDPGVGSFGLRVNGFTTGGSLSFSGPTTAESISRLAVSTNFGDVFNWISAGPFQITSITRSGNNVVLVWNTRVGSNIVQVSQGTGPSASFATNTFSDLFTNVVTVSTLGTGTFTDTGGATNKPTRYYRVRVPQ